MPAQIISFVSRKQLLVKRGIQAYGRFKSVSIGATPAHGPVHRQWQAEALENKRRDAAWALRHGAVEGGGTVVPFGAPILDECCG